MNRQIEAGTVIAGTLRDEDLLEVFASELETVCRLRQKHLRLRTPLGIAYDDWSRVIAHKKLIFDARALTDESVEDIDMASEIVNELMDALSEYAPEGMYFGTLEGDGADFGWWHIGRE